MTYLTVFGEKRYMAQSCYCTALFSSSSLFSGQERLILQNTELAGLAATARHHHRSLEAEVETLKSTLMDYKSKLSVSEDNVAHLESERAALRERVLLLEAEGVEAANESRQELESGVVELTNQVRAACHNPAPQETGIGICSHVFPASL